MAQEMVYPLLPIFLIVALSSSTTALGAVAGPVVTVCIFRRLRRVRRHAAAPARPLGRAVGPRPRVPVLAAFNLVYALMAVPFGALSDRVARRPLLFLAWAVYVLVYVGFASGTAARQQSRPTRRRCPGRLLQHSP
jgi:MFS family permease